ncbi:MAG: hypothetical protein WCV73_03480 [Patescibacteria group bacterium]|jgi:hypothetical protein
MKQLNKKSRLWSAKLAYAVGLIATDGNLSKDKRHITFVSKDLQLIQTFKTCLDLKTKVSLKKSGFAPDKTYYCVQFSDVNLYNLLIEIGLTPAKSKTIDEIKIPKKFFPDFIRGLFDGDGSFYSYWDKRWKSSFMFYLSFCSASIKHINWLQQEMQKQFDVKGHINKSFVSRAYQLKYAKNEARIVIKKMYYSKNIPLLKRKLNKINLTLKQDI